MSLFEEMETKMTLFEEMETKMTLLVATIKEIKLLRVCNEEKYNQGREKYKHEIEEIKNEKISTGASATQFPRASVFTTRNLHVHLIDTSGIGDTRGPQQIKMRELCDVEDFIIRYLENYVERDIISVNDYRRIIKTLCAPLANKSKFIDLILATLDNKKEELRRLDSNLEDINNPLFMTHSYLETEALANPRTVCTSPNCTYKPDFGTNAVSVLDALQTCKSHGIIHGDIKPENILLNRNGLIKLCDFGESKILTNSLTSTFDGTIPYWPPERFDHQYNEKNNEKADVWSLGVTLVEVASHKHPYMEKNETIEFLFQTASRFTQKFAQIIHEHLGKYSNAFQQFMFACLQDVENRPKFQDLKSLEFYKDHVDKVCSVYMNSMKKRVLNERRCSSDIKYTHSDDEYTQSDVEFFNDLKYIPIKIDSYKYSNVEVVVPIVQNKLFGWNQISDRQIYKGRYTPGSVFYEDKIILFRSCMDSEVASFNEVIGGSNANIHPNSSLKDVWRINLLTREWVELEIKGDIPNSLIMYSACLSSNHLSDVTGFIFGGAIDPDGNQLSNTLYSFYIDDSTIFFNKPNMDAVANQMKGFHLQQSTLNSQNLLPMNKPPNPMLENTPINRPANLNYNPNPYDQHQKYTPNYPNSVTYQSSKPLLPLGKRLIMDQKIPLQASVGILFPNNPLPGHII